MYDRILVPLDGTTLAEAALPFAELIPSTLVYLLRVAPGAEGRANGVARTPADRRALDQLQVVGERFRRQGREVEAIVFAGDPAKRIVEAAADVDLIVMATHGRGAGRRALYGGVADEVARWAPVPTLVARGGERPVGGPPITRLVVPLDGSALAEEALPAAVELASVLGVAIHLVRVVTPSLMWEALAGGGTLVDGRSTLDDAIADATSYLDEQCRRLRGRDLAVTRDVRSGAPVSELMASFAPGDLVVLSSHGRSGSQRWLIGSVAETLVREAAVPVLLVPAAAAGVRSPVAPDEVGAGR